MRCSWGLLWMLGCGSVGSNATGDAPVAGDAQAGDAQNTNTNTAPGTIRWARSLSSVGVLGLADGPGGVIVSGELTAPAQLGGDTLVPPSGVALVVAGFDDDSASHVYSVAHGATGNAFGFLHDVSSLGAPFVYGLTSGTVDLGTGTTLAGGGGSDGFFGLYGTSAATWLARLVGPGEDKFVASAAGSGSAVYGAGWFEQTTTFTPATGAAQSLTSAGGRDLFLARFNQFTGQTDLVRSYGSAGREEVSGAAGRGDRLILTGMFDDTAANPLAFGGTASPLTSAGDLDVWVARLDTAGNGVWAMRFGGTGVDRDPRVAIDEAGDVYVSGSFSGQVAFGAINLISKGGPDVFVAKLRGADGTVAWATSLGSAAPDSVALNDGTFGISAAGGRVVVAGRVAGPLDGDASSGGLDGFLTCFDAATGAKRWQRVFSTAGDDTTWGVTIGRTGDVYAVVSLGGAYDFGVPIIGAAQPASALLRIAP